MQKRILTILSSLTMILALGAASFTNVSAAALQGATVPLNDSHVGATNPGFSVDSCPTPPAGQEGWFGWHFIMPQNNNFTSLSVTFQSAGTFSADPFPGSVFVAHPDNSHAYIWTPTADTLLAGSATSDGDNTFFNLSHVCPGSDPTNTPTNTSVPPTNTSTNTPTNTSVPPTNTSTNTPTNTSVPPTNTATDTPTNSSVPPTNTSTNTPTNTPIPPTNTSTNTPTNTPVPNMGQLKVCKVAGAGVTPGTLFTINVNGMPYNVPAGRNDGFCVLAGQFPLNTNVTIQEVIPAGYIVARIEVLPNSRAVSKNLAIGKVVVKIGTGVTEAIFTNKVSGLPTKTPTAIVTPRATRTPVSTTPAPTGRLQICKEADGPGVTGNFTFTFAGKTRTIPVGACTSLIVVPVGPLTITEVARPGFTLTDVYTIPGDRLISENLAARTVTVTIVQGYSYTQTIVVFRNSVQTTQNR